MTNGTNFLNDMEFENQLNEYGDDQLALTRFIARQQWQMSKSCSAHNERLCSLEKRDRKILGFTGGIAAIIGAVIVSIINFFVSKG